MPRGIDPRGVSADRLPSKGMGGPIPDFGQYQDFTDTLGRFVDDLLQKIKDWTGIDLFWLLDWSWTTNTLLELVRQVNDLFGWLQNPMQSPPNLLSRPSFSSPSAIVEAPDWEWDAVCSLGTTVGAWGQQVTDPQGSAKTIADGSRHALLSNAITDKAALTPGQILVCQVHALVEAGFTAADDQALRLEVIPSWHGVPREPVVVAHCGVPDGAPGDWIAASVGSKAVFFDADWTVPADGTVDTVELRLVVGESAGGNVAVRFDGGRVAAAGGFLVVLSDLFDAGRIYLTALWDAITAWLEDVFDAGHWTALKNDTDAAFDEFVRRVKRALHHADADIFHPPSTSSILENALRGNPWFGWIFEMVDTWLQPVLKIGKAGTAFFEAIWHAITYYIDADHPDHGNWSKLTGAITAAWNTMVDAVFAAWGSDKTHADVPDPGTATRSVLTTNPVTGWLFGDGFGDAVESIINVLGLGPLVDWFTRLINDLGILFDIFHVTYTSSQWKAALKDLMTITLGEWAGNIVDPGSVADANSQTGGSGHSSQNANDLVTGADPTVPHAPTFGFLNGDGIVALSSPANDSVPYPGVGDAAIFYYYVVTAVKGGVESVPSAEKFVVIISPGQVTLKWTASKTAGCTYNVYRGTQSGKWANRVATGLTVTTFTDGPQGGPAVSPGTTAGHAGTVAATANTNASVAQGSATSAGNDVAAVGSQVASVVAPSIPKAPSWLAAMAVPLTGGRPGVGAAGKDVWYRVTATNAAGESIASNAVYVHASWGPIAVKLSWVKPAGATSINVYRGIADNPLLLFPKEPALPEFAVVGNVSEWTDMGD